MFRYASRNLAVSGTVVSEMKYTAFGEVWSENGVSPTDYAYTGQRYEAEFGLSYYVARWYDPQISHFVQADSLIPQPGNAGDWDRYAYVLWNPINFNDPTGHQVCTEEGYCFDGNSSIDGYLNYLAGLYGVNFTTGEDDDNPNAEWDWKVKYAFVVGIQSFAEKLSQSLEIADSVLAFRNFFSISDKEITLQYGCSQCSKLGWANHPVAKTVSFAGFYNAVAFMSNVTLIIHELTHVWERTVGYPSSSMSSSIADRSGLKDNPPGSRFIWQQNPWSNDNTEIFADMMIAWVLDEWANELTADNVSTRQRNWMNESIPTFYEELVINGD